MLVRGQQLPGAFPPLERYLEPLREQAGIPGMSAAVVQNGEIIWEAGLRLSGRRSAESRATPDTPYLVADLSQTLAAILVLQCVEQRHMYLDEPVTRYGMSLPEPAATLRHVLTSHLRRPSRRDVPVQPRAVPAADVSGGVVRTTAVPKERRPSHSQSARDEGFRAGHRPEGFARSSRKTCSIQADMDRYQQILERMAVPYKVDNRRRAERSEFTPEGHERGRRAGDDGARSGEARRRARFAADAHRRDPRRRLDARNEPSR